jgi:hypothetical protein
MKVTGQSVLTPRSKTMTGSCCAGGLDDRRQRGGRVGRDDEDVAVAAGQQAVDVADLLVVGAFGVDVDELLDVRVQVDLGLHGREADDAPGVVHAGVREADRPGAFRGVGAGVDVGRVDGLDPGLSAGPSGSISM